LVLLNLNKYSLRPKISVVLASRGVKHFWDGGSRFGAAIMFKLFIFTKHSLIRSDLISTMLRMNENKEKEAAVFFSIKEEAEFQ
jgi:hypothetical protein